MPDFPIAHAPGYTERPTASNTTVTSSASTNTKGSYVELIASTPRDWDALLATFNVNTNTASMLIDIAVGGAGSEQIIVPDLLFAGVGTDRLARHFLAPVAIPAGSRISARCACSTGSTATTMAVSGLVGSFWSTPPAGRLVTLGINSAASRGTLLDSGAVTGTYGAWAQLDAATGADIAGLSLIFGNNNNNVPSISSVSANTRLQLGVGAASSEQVILDGIPFTTSAGGIYGPLPAFWFPCSIPAGSRVAARIALNFNDATDRVVDLAAYGLVI